MYCILYYDCCVILHGTPCCDCCVAQNLLMVPSLLKLAMRVIRGAFALDAEASFLGAVVNFFAADFDSCFDCALLAESPLAVVASRCLLLAPPLPPILVYVLKVDVVAAMALPSSVIYYCISIIGGRSCGGGCDAGE